MRRLRITRAFDANFASWRRVELPLELLRGWPAPIAVELEDEHLFWCYADNWARTLEVTPRHMRHLFADFIKLAEPENSTADDILKFARRWGVLNLCEHGLPSSHILGPAFQEGFNYVRCEPPQREDGMYYEPLAMWRLYARRIKALDNIITNRRRPEKVGVQDWQVVTDWLPSLSGAKQTDEDRLALVINRVLEIADVRPLFAWRENELVFTLASISDSRLSLLTGLMIWAALNHRFSDLFTTCAACSAPVELAASQSFRRNHYCADCGMKAAWRQAGRKYRERERENPARKRRKRLVEEEVKAIRHALNSRKDTRFPPSHADVSQLAEQYGVSVWTIYKIAEGKTWEHVK